MSIEPIGIQIFGPLAGFAEGYGMELTQLATGCGFSTLSVIIRKSLITNVFLDLCYGLAELLESPFFWGPLCANEDETRTCREFTLGGVGQTSRGYAPNQRQQDPCGGRR
jgi:hypothetical protein